MKKLFCFLAIFSCSFSQAQDVEMCGEKIFFLQEYFDLSLQGATLHGGVFNEPTGTGEECVEIWIYD